MTKRNTYATKAENEAFAKGYTTHENSAWAHQVEKAKARFSKPATKEAFERGVYESQCARYGQTPR